MCTGSNICVVGSGDEQVFDFAVGRVGSKVGRKEVVGPAGTCQVKVGRALCEPGGWVPSDRPGGESYGAAI